MNLLKSTGSKTSFKSGLWPTVFIKNLLPSKKPFGCRYINSNFSWNQNTGLIFLKRAYFTVHRLRPPFFVLLLGGEKKWDIFVGNISHKNRWAFPPLAERVTSASGSAHRIWRIKILLKIKVFILYVLYGDGTLKCPENFCSPLILFFFSPSFDG